MSDPTPDPAVVERAADVLAEHHTHLGPVSGSWVCTCGVVSTNGTPADNSLTSREDRCAEYDRHVADALAAANLLATTHGAGDGEPDDYDETAECDCAVHPRFCAWNGPCCAGCGHDLGDEPVDQQAVTE